VSGCFCEQLDYNLLFRWFLDLALDEKSFDHSGFTSNRQRLLEHEVAGEFFRGVLEEARAKLSAAAHGSPSDLKNFSTVRPSLANRAVARARPL
jgi:hypothetical protein